MKSTVPPWVIVAGGFHQHGGMDKANYALAKHLVDRGVRVHLVTHRVDEPLAGHPLVVEYPVGRPVRSYFLGGRLLGRVGAKVADEVTRVSPRATVLVNGGNCAWAGINWSHYVHHAWNPTVGRQESIRLRAKRAMDRTVARATERTAYRRAKLILANSELTRRQILSHRLQTDASRVKTVYLGSDSSWGLPTAAERQAARSGLGIQDDRPVVVFVGALNLDDRKGFGTVFDAWTGLCRDSAWRADLFVAGDGRALPAWSAKIQAAGLGDRIRMLGFSPLVRDLLAAADLLVSPAQYEPYGLNVQEALCRGVPAIVSRTAGVAEQYPGELEMMLLADPGDHRELERTLVLWSQNQQYWREVVRPLGDRLRRYIWDEMATRIVELVDGLETEPSSMTAPTAIRGVVQ